MTIQFATKGYGLYQAEGAEGMLKDYALGFVEPFGTLWFIYMLAVFFVVVKATRFVPPMLVFTAGALLEMAPIETGHMVIDEFASRFVYFYVGYWLAGYVFKFAEGVNFKSVPVILSGLFIWAVRQHLHGAQRFGYVPGLGLALGFIGAAAVVSTGVLLSKTRLAAPFRYAGENSIVIYLAFFLFMAATRSLLLKYKVITDLGSVALLTTAAGVVGPILLFWATRHTKLSLLFRRPAWARLASRASPMA